ncbi:hypothetical protein ABZ307_44220 [Streptomyces griseorubiginosus]|uniref:hypothetical protein n=1 Tax=Streptomyces griseorubiginosus TaxID=67304 RepID=UPI0033AFB27E
MRGAFSHLFHVMQKRAGEHFDPIMGDNRVGEFFRKVSINVCAKVAGWAQAGADQLRRRGERKYEGLSDTAMAAGWESGGQGAGLAR